MQAILSHLWPFILHIKTQLGLVWASIRLCAAERDSGIFDMLVKMTWSLMHLLGPEEEGMKCTAPQTRTDACVPTDFTTVPA